jgi:hypothetical protein
VEMRSAFCYCVGELELGSGVGISDEDDKWVGFVMKANCELWSL